jgi:hypothetical protein
MARQHRWHGAEAKQASAGTAVHRTTTARTNIALLLAMNTV